MHPSLQITCLLYTRNLFSGRTASLHMHRVQTKTEMYLFSAMQHDFYLTLSESINFITLLTPAPFLHYTLNNKLLKQAYPFV